MSSHRHASVAWRRESRCLNLDSNLFFAESGRLPATATAPCRECPVKAQCLAFALDSPWEPYGVWGGLPAHEIRALWREVHTPGSPDIGDTSLGDEVA
jgi:WhiB family redox-sensing transcriptional regulator